VKDELLRRMIEAGVFRLSWSREDGYLLHGDRVVVPVDWDEGDYLVGMAHEARRPVSTAADA
jgi:hypothetical protein